MKIVLNGQLKELAQPLNLNELIGHVNKGCQRVVAEVNGNIIKTTQWDTTSINDGDTIELVTLVGGG